MTTWILVYIITGFSGYQGNSAVATGTVIFHSQKACEDAAQKFHNAFCVEDPIPTQPEAH